MVRRIATLSSSVGQAGGGNKGLVCVVVCRGGKAWDAGLKVDVGCR